MKRAAALLALACSACATMGNVGLAAAEASLAVDYGSTMTASRDWSRFHEDNPILGSNPSQVAISSYMMTSALATALVWYKLPRWARPLWSAAIVSFEMEIVAGNEREGVPFP